MELLHLSASERPEESHVWSLLGREYVLKEDYNKALEILFETLNKKDIEYSNGRRVLVYTLYLIALCYFNLGNYEECRWYCEEFIRVNPTYREPYFLMARAMNEQKLYTLAEATVESGLKYGAYKRD